MSGRRRDLETTRERFLLLGAVVWLAMPVAAIANGIVREVLLAPLLGPVAAEPLSVLTLLAIIYGIATLHLRRAGSQRPLVDLWLLGLLWMVLTVFFEFVFFGFVMGVPFAELRQAYDIRQGEPWSVVVIGVLLAPLVTGLALRRLRRRV